jgi:hypothetical protein
MFNSPKSTGTESSIRSGFDVSATQREMVYTAFRDTLRMTGVPHSFLECECVHFVDARNAPQFQVHLIMKKWSGQMLRYSKAFQSQMRICLDRFEPHVDHGAYEWLWKYAKDCDVPFPDMPAPEEWTKKKEASAPRPAVDFFERRKVPRMQKGKS